MSYVLVLIISTWSTPLWQLYSWQLERTLGLQRKQLYVYALNLAAYISQSWNLFVAVLGCIRQVSRSPKCDSGEFHIQGREIQRRLPNYSDPLNHNLKEMDLIYTRMALWLIRKGEMLRRMRLALRNSEGWSRTFLSTKSVDKTASRIWRAWSCRFQLDEPRCQ